ncbi:MAG: DUF3524 domain-containing protein [Saprospiraceae bacterium]|nr:DUF3524 domain-containing protein [Saprospiraceae bacterium]
MKILVIEPYLTDSHQRWIDGFRDEVTWEVQTLTLPARHWKWRMHAAAITLSGLLDSLNYTPDVLIVSEMMDVALFKALICKAGHGHLPILLYFHENQLCYPISASDEDHKKHFDNHYAFINYTSALTADQLIFNSTFHQDVFLNALPKFLKGFPKPNTIECQPQLAPKSTVIYPGMSFRLMKPHQRYNNPHPIILWNHRWEYDKNPRLFFDTLTNLNDLNIDFRLVVIGKSFGKIPKAFSEAREEFSDKILQWGQVKSINDYYTWLARSDIVVSTSLQDFFGISVVEAMYHRCWPILPNRLAFPEHIPKEFQSECLYDHDADLLPLLRKAIDLHPRYCSAMDNIMAHIKRYDVSAVNAQYKRLFAKIFSTKGS